MSEREKLQQLLDSNEELARLFIEDASVYACLLLVKYGKATVEEALVQAIIHLRRDKAHYFNETMTALGKTPPSGIIGPKQ